MSTRRLVVAVVLVALAGGAVGTTLARSASKSPVGRPTARFTVSGSASRGVIVSYADSRSPTRVIESGSVPLQASVSKKGIAFYKFRARLLTPGGHITCTLRVGNVVAVRHASGTNSLCVVRARPPGGPSSTGGPDHASFDLKPPPKPTVTAAMVAAAHRDEARMLHSFVPPPGAQPLAHEPALLQQTKIFGVGPTSSAKFVRFGNWRVRSSVAAVMSFEQAHPPRGGTSLGYGVNNGPNVPPNRSLVIIFPRIHGLVSSRIMRVSILRLPSGWTAIRVAATNRTWIPHRFRHRAPPPSQIDFVASQQAPIAGQTFTGVTVIDENPQISPLLRVSCGGLLGNHALPGSQHVFTTAPPSGRAGAFARAEKVTKVEEVTCSWHIPVNTVGERLRLGTGHADSARVAARTARTSRMPAATISSPEYSWVVHP